MALCKSPKHICIFQSINPMSHPNETIDNKSKSFIISVSGDNITADVMVKSEEDFPALDGLIDSVKKQVYPSYPYKKEQ